MELHVIMTNKFQSFSQTVSYMWTEKYDARIWTGLMAMKCDNYGELLRINYLHTSFPAQCK